ncbi:MAG: Rv3654c family TadE-like protein [Nocardioides sp.]
MRRAARARDDSGTATVLVMPLLGIVVLAAVLVSLLGSLLVAQRRVQAAADLSALAGASAASRAGDACASAARLSRRNGADLVTCRLEGREIWLEVALEVTGLLGRSVTVRAQARAGPASGGAGLAVPRP